MRRDLLGRGILEGNPVSGFTPDLFGADSGGFRAIKLNFSSFTINLYLSNHRGRRGTQRGINCVLTQYLCGSPWKHGSKWIVRLNTRHAFNWNAKLPSLTDPYLNSFSDDEFSLSDQALLHIHLCGYFFVFVVSRPIAIKTQRSTRSKVCVNYRPCEGICLAGGS